ncbi:MAG: polyprenyl synthetase family protein, partial [Desulfurococcaceae archaeon]|nr:polyprenyl synthetase family protein [Desulfurococcaceae archaeon]
MTPTSQEDEYADFLNKVVNEVNTRLREFFRELASEALRENRRVIELADVGADYTLRGGKRLRAVLVATGCWC